MQVRAAISARATSWQETRQPSVAGRQHAGYVAPRALIVATTHANHDIALPIKASVWLWLLLIGWPNYSVSPRTSHFFKQLSQTLARNIAKKVDINDCSFVRLTLILSPHYLVKCRSRSLAVHINEFILGSGLFFQTRCIMLRSIEIVNSCSREAETGGHHRQRSKHWK